MLAAAPILLNPIPSPSSMIWYINGDNLNGSGNAGLTAGASLTTGTVKNLGTRGGSFTASATPPVFDVEGSRGSIKFSGTNFLFSAVGALIAQPIMFAVVWTQPISGVGLHSTLFDGVVGGGGANCSGIIHTFDTEISAGTALGSTYIGQVGPWQLLVCTFAGASSWIDPFDSEAAMASGGSSHNIVGNAGTGTPSGLTIGAAAGGGNPIVAGSRIALLAGWSGTLPNENDVIEWVYGRGLVGFGSSSSVGLTTITRPARSIVAPPATQPKLAVHGGDKIVFLGDSLTAGGWMVPLETTINASVVTPCTFVNAGHGGETSAEMDARFATDVVATGCQTCVLETGINDGTFSMGVDVFQGHIQSMITKAFAASIKFMFVTLLCFGEQLPDFNNKRWRQYIEAARYTCMLNGVPYVDMRTPQQEYEAVNNLPLPGNFNSPGPLGQVLLTADGRHPGAGTNGATFMSGLAAAEMVFSG
jgi:hypothetical protein